MNLSEIHDWTGPPRGQPVADLTGALRALGVQVEFWQNHTPRPLDVDAVRTHFEESAETSLRDHDILLRKFAEGDPEIAELVVRSMAESLFGATSHEKFTLLSKGHDGYLELLRGLNSASYIWWLVSVADRLAEDGNIDSAIEVYREAIEECPRPNLHSELGRILADRAGVSSHLVGAPESAILSELDISLPLTFTWNSSGNETSTRPQQPELLEDSLLDHPLGSQSKKLLRLALESYGRAYVGHLTELADEMTSMEAESLFSRHCLVLDGLRVLFLEMDMLEEAEIVSVTSSRYGMALSPSRKAKLPGSSSCDDLHRPWDFSREEGSNSSFSKPSSMLDAPSSYQTRTRSQTTFCRALASALAAFPLARERR